MTITRRDLMRGSLAATLFAACGGTSAPKTASVPKKKILILGGTGFIGPVTVAAAIARGHEVTVFNRGKREKTRPLEQKVEHLYGNRDPLLPADDDKGPDGQLLHPDGSPKGLEQLAGRTFDCVIDNSGFYPRIVKASAEALKTSGQYIYISSISAYADATIPASGGDENTPLATMDDPTLENMGEQMQFYGSLKALCEKAAQDVFGERATVVRPGFIVGPGDPTDRFTYWPVRASKGGEMLAPGAPDDPLQWIDVRDLAAWLVKLAEDGTHGTFNALGPSRPAKWGDVLNACVAASPNAGTKLVWVSTEWLDKKGKLEDESFPIWIPPVGKFAGFHRFNNDRAEAAGLTFHPVADTLEALLDWWPGEMAKRAKITQQLVADAQLKGTPPPKLGDPSAMRAGPSADAEKAILDQFRTG
ncbi:MAG TPA: NAD-dependent epimerase/dehydratase family protein [Kofleriaceae bacterium]